MKITIKTWWCSKLEHFIQENKLLNLTSTTKRRNRIRFFDQIINFRYTYLKKHYWVTETRTKKFCYSFSFSHSLLGQQTFWRFRPHHLRLLFHARILHTFRKSMWYPSNGAGQHEHKLVASSMEAFPILKQHFKLYLHISLYPNTPSHTDIW